VLLTGLLDQVAFWFGVPFCFAVAIYLQEQNPQSNNFQWNAGMLLFTMGIFAAFIQNPEGSWMSSLFLGVILVTVAKITKLGQ
jgi:hypothetical protein